MQLKNPCTIKIEKDIALLHKTIAALLEMGLEEEDVDFNAYVLSKFGVLINKSPLFVAIYVDASFNILNHPGVTPGRKIHIVHDETSFQLTLKTIKDEIDENAPAAGTNDSTPDTGGC